MRKKWIPKAWPRSKIDAVNRMSDEDLKHLLEHYARVQWPTEANAPADQRKLLIDTAVDHLLRAIVALQTEQRMLRGAATEAVIDIIDAHVSVARTDGRICSVYPFAVVDAYAQRGYRFTHACRVFEVAIDLAGPLQDDQLSHEYIDMVNTPCLVLLSAMEKHEQRALFHDDVDACCAALRLARHLVLATANSTLGQVIASLAPSTIFTTAVATIALVHDLGLTVREFEHKIKREGNLILPTIHVLAQFPALRTREVLDFVLTKQQRIIPAFPGPIDFARAVERRNQHFPSVSLDTLTTVMERVHDLDNATALFAIADTTRGALRIAEVAAARSLALATVVPLLAEAKRHVPLDIACESLMYIAPTELIPTITDVGLAQFPLFVSVLAHMPLARAREIRAHGMAKTVDEYVSMHIIRKACPHTPWSLLREIGHAVRWAPAKATRILTAHQRGVPLPWLLARTEEFTTDALVLKWRLETILGRHVSQLECTMVQSECAGVPSIRALKKLLRKTTILDLVPATDVQLQKKAPAARPAPRTMQVHSRDIRILCDDLVPTHVRADHVSTILVWGFVMPTQSRAFFNENYLPERNVRSNAGRKLKKGFSVDAYNTALHWLMAIGVVIEPTHKGTSEWVLSMSLKSDDPVGQELIRRACALRPQS